MSAPLRVAVIGAGIADRHVAAFRWLPRQYDVAVVCSLDEERGRALCRRHDVREFSRDAAATMACEACAPGMASSSSWRRCTASRTLASAGTSPTRSSRTGLSSPVLT